MECADEKRLYETLKEPRFCYFHSAIASLSTHCGFAAMVCRLLRGTAISRMQDELHWVVVI